MNAALIAACANSGKHNQSKPTYPYHEVRKVERPVIGMIRVLNDRDTVVLDDLQNDGVELRFRSVMAVDELIRKLQRLKDNMLVLEGEET